MSHGALRGWWLGLILLAATLSALADRVEPSPAEKAYADASRELARARRAGGMESRTGRSALTAAVAHLETALKLRGDYVSAALLLGEIQLIRGRSDAAVPLLTQIKAKHPANTRLAYLLGVHLFRLERYALGAPHLEQAANADESALDARVLLARYYYRERRLKRSLKHATEAVALAPSDPDVHGLIGNIHLREERLEAAARAFRRVLTLKPDSIPVRVNLGTVLYRLKDYESAAVLYEEVLQRTQGIPSVQFNLGSCYYRMARWAKAAARFEAYLKTDEGNAQAHFFAGTAYASLRRLEPATRHLARATMLDERDPWAPFALAKLALEQRDLETADTFAETALQRAANEPELLVVAGVVARERGDFPRAIARLEAAIPLAPKDLGPRRELGIALALSGRTNDAIDVFEAARTLSPSDTTVTRWLSVTRTHRALDQIGAGRLDDARADLERALEVNPSALEAAWNLVLLHDRENRGSDALAVVQRGLTHVPNHPDLHLLAAWVLVRDGEIERAQGRLQRAAGASDAGLRWLVQAAIHAYLGEFGAARAAFSEARSAGMDLGQALDLLALDQAADRITRGDVDRALRGVRALTRLAPELERVRAGLVASALLSREDGLAKLPSLFKLFTSGPIPPGFGLEALSRDAQLVVGWAHYRFGREDAAEKALRRHLARRPDDPRGRRILATLLADRAERAYARHDERRAQVLLDEAQRLVTGDVQLEHNAAVAQHRAQKGALGGVFRRLHEAGRVAEATLNLGLYLEDVEKRQKDAIPLYRRYLDQGGLASEVARNRLSRRQRIFGREP